LQRLCKLERLTVQLEGLGRGRDSASEQGRAVAQLG
jgi:hypothetical protein